MFFPSSIIQKAAAKQSNNPSKPKALDSRGGQKAKTSAPRENQKAKSERIFSELRAKMTPERMAGVKAKGEAMRARSAPAKAPTSAMKKMGAVKARKAY